MYGSKWFVSVVVLLLSMVWLAPHGNTRAQEEIELEGWIEVAFTGTVDPNAATADPMAPTYVLHYGDDVSEDFMNCDECYILIFQDDTVFNLPAEDAQEGGYFIRSGADSRYLVRGTEGEQLSVSIFLSAPSLNVTYIERLNVGASSATPSAPAPADIGVTKGRVAATVASVNLRSGPGQGFSVIQGVPNNTEVTILEANPDQSWYHVRLADGTEGWISASLLTIVAAPPPPTALPTATSTPAPTATQTESAETYFNRGIGNLTDSDFAHAVENFTRAIELDPGSILAYNARGYAYGMLGQYEAAMADFNEVIRLDPQWAEGYLNRGTTYSFMGEQELAIADYDQAIALGYGEGFVYSNRGFSYYELGEYDLALADLNLAVELDPIIANPYVNRCQVYNALEDYEKAIADCTFALRLDPNYAISYLQRAIAYHARHQNELAMDDLHTYDQLAGDNADPHAADLMAQIEAEAATPEPTATPLPTVTPRPTFTPSPTLPTTPDISQEDAALFEVGCLNKEAYEEFLAAFPDGENAERVRNLIDLLDQIGRIQSGEGTPSFVIPFEDLGDYWAYWMEYNPDTGAIGYGMRGGFLSVVIQPGCNEVSFDGNGNLAPYTGDGSILTFMTNGSDVDFLNDISIQSDGSGTLYFAVLKELGLVYLRGEGTVTLANGEEVVLPIKEE